MVAVKYQYDTLSTREGFNRSLKHFKLVMELIEDFESNYNLADLLNTYLVEKKILVSQIKPILNSLLFDKYHYYYSSYNIQEPLTNFDAIVKEVSTWKSYDIVLAYFHPELGILPINPKNHEHWETAQVLKKNELITIFVGEFTKTDPDKNYSNVINTIIKLIQGKNVKAPPSFKKGKFTLKKKRATIEDTEELSPPAFKNRPVLQKYEKKQEIKHETVEPVSQKKMETVTPKSMRMTPMYGIVVTNELFHNGNVEAWKKIIFSYEHTYSGNRVLVFYDGERINDINTLFKWGKVKRGTAIMISIVGENITAVAKLKRYLMQGASHRFEDFLKGPPNQILKLF